MSSNGLYRFDEFTLNPYARTLARHGEPVALSPKAFEVLTYLVKNPGRVVLKDELLSAVWPGTFVEESNLAQHISSLRKALGSMGYIATVPGRGYQFTAEVKEELPAGEIPASGFVVQTVRERARIVVSENATTGVAADRVLPASRKNALRIWLAVAALLLVAAGTWFGWRWKHPPVAGDTHQIVIADFDNRTGEDVFDYVLKNALEIDMEQSPLFNIVSVAETRRTLQQMDRSPEDRLTPSIAREVCERNNAQAVLNGSVLKLGTSYVITLEAVDCVSGKKLVELQTQAANKDGTLKALSDLVSKMRRKLGESLHSVQGFDIPIEQSTTSSFDALVAYSHGVALYNADSIPYFERAIQLDPNFAMAYEQLGVTYGNLADIPAAKRAFAKAYELRQTADAHEQFVITSRYYEIVQNDLDLAAKNYELWTRSYPLDRFAWGTLANTYTQMGYYPQAIAAGERELAIARNHPFTYVVLSRAYKRASQFDKAKAVCNEAIARKLDNWGVHSILFQIAVAEHDTAAIARETVWDKGQATENQTLDNAAFAAATMGQLKNAKQLFQQAQDSPAAQKTVDYALDIDADKAEAERLLGDFDHARAHAVQVPIDHDETSFEAALNAALSGDTAYTNRVIEQERTAPATSTLMQKVRIPLLQAAIALQEHKPAQAVTLLQPAKVYEFRDYYVPSLLGEAYLEMHRATEAVAEYQEILANPGIDPLSPMYPLAHLGLARAYAMQHKVPESRSEYEKFFTLWKDADTDTPMLKTAR